MNDFGSRHWPEEIHYHRDRKVLEVAFENGERFEIPAELLRVESPSAEVQGHSPDQKQVVSGRRHVGVIGIEPVGNYAVRISFDDLHDTGLYTWDYLYDMGKNQDSLWERYLAELEQAGLSREPRPGESSKPTKSGGCGGGGGHGHGHGGCGCG